MINKEISDRQIAPEILQSRPNHLTYFSAQDFPLEISTKKHDVLQDPIIKH